MKTKFKVLCLSVNLILAFNVYSNQKGGGGGECKQEFSRVFTQVMQDIEHYQVNLPQDLSVSKLDQNFSKIKLLEKESIIDCYDEENVPACSLTESNIIELRCDESSNSWKYLSQVDKKQNVIHEVLFWVENIDDQNGRFSSQIILELEKKKATFGNSSSESILSLPGTMSVSLLETLSSGPYCYGGLCPLNHYHFWTVDGNRNPPPLKKILCDIDLLDENKREFKPFRSEKATIVTHREYNYGATYGSLLYRQYPYSNYDNDHITILLPEQALAISCQKDFMRENDGLSISELKSELEKMNIILHDY